MSEETTAPWAASGTDKVDEVRWVIECHRYSLALRRIRDAGTKEDFREALEALSPEDRAELQKGVSALERSLVRSIADFETNAAAVLPALKQAQDRVESAKEGLPADSRSLAPPAPPPLGEALIGLFCKNDIREAVLGDLDEKFAELAERRGARFAKAWYWGQAGRSVLFFAVRWGRRLLELEAILKRIL